MYLLTFAMLLFYLSNVYRISTGLSSASKSGMSCSSNKSAGYLEIPPGLDCTSLSVIVFSPKEDGDVEQLMAIQTSAIQIKPFILPSNL